MNLLPAQLTLFAARRETQARELAAHYNAQLPAVVWAYFAAARQGNWTAVSRLWEELRNPPHDEGRPRPDLAVRSQVWASAMEIVIGFEAFALGEPKYALAFGRDIIESIPLGSIYLGGTDAGRGLVTILCKSHETGDPFFTLTQNSLFDHSYLRYLHAIYGDKILLPSEEDCQQVTQEYLQDLLRRQVQNQLRPGEIPPEMVDGKPQLTGAITVWGINGALAKLLFERNPERQFFAEESFPLEWMYPHLAPHGLILKINREAEPAITPEQVNEDRNCWNHRVATMLGAWLLPETPLAEVCEFAQKIYLRKDFTGFEGDPKYALNDYVCRAFSKLRNSIAGLYAWRARADSEPNEKQRMSQAADFAFRQALALCPYSPEVVFRYLNFLLSERRSADALQLATTSLNLTPGNQSLQSLVQRLTRSPRAG